MNLKELRDEIKSMVKQINAIPKVEIKKLAPYNQLMGMKKIAEAADKMEAENTTLLIDDNASERDYKLWEEIKGLLKEVEE